MGLEIFIIFLVLFSFILAIGFPSFFILKKIYFRPSVKIVGYKTRQKQANGYFSPEETALVLDLFQKCWNENIDDRNLKPIFDKLNIYWKKEPIQLGQVYKINDKKFSMASGITRSRTDIEVWIYDKNKEIKISNTALAHELIHVVLWNLEGDPDADHEDSFYPGWTEKHTDVERLVNKILKEKGL